MKLQPPYSVRFRSPQAWSIWPVAAQEAEAQFFFFAEGRAEGRITGEFRGANHPARRSDGTFLPDSQGVITIEDGAVVYFDCRGYGRSYPRGRRQVVGTATHLRQHEQYRWNDSVAVGTGEVTTLEDGSTELVLEWAELIGEPPSMSAGEG